MKTALFLDVDGVLTETPVNMQIAAALGVDRELAQLEAAFTSGEIDNTKFNRVFIPLFRKAGFTEAWMREHFDEIQTRVNFSRLLTACDDVFLVSSGPSYYLEPFAERHSFPRSNVLCSVYDFNKEGQINKCQHPVSSAVKGSFVKERVGSYDLTFGVGDSVRQDVSFLSQCKIKIIMGNEPTLEYLSAREIQPILDAISAIRASPPVRQTNIERDAAPDLKTFERHAKGDKNVFVIMPFRDDARYRELERALKEELAANGFKGWLAKDATLNPELWRNVRAFMLGCQYGIAVFTPADDAGVYATKAYNPNIAAEMGFMLARDKPTLLLKEQKLNGMFTDFGGFVAQSFDLASAEQSVRPIVRSWLAGLA